MPIQRFPDRYDGAPAGLRVAVGDIEGVSFVHRFGFVDTAKTGAETLWPVGVDYAYLSAAASLELLSTSAADTSAGTGAQEVRIIGLDDSFEIVDNAVATNGTGVVSIPDSYRRINSVFVTTGGTGQKNAGDITVRVSGAGATQAFIPTGIGLAPQVILTVGNVAGFITQWGISTRAGGNDQLTAVLEQHSIDDQMVYVRDTLQADSDATSAIVQDYEVPIFVAPRSDIQIRVSSTANNTGASGFVQVYFVENLGALGTFPF